ncbi:MAG: acetate/propionate family kinase, partial [Chloroflexota bacterium]|nr:acetate/propionate family kinase [Chloroflexota bacterium]
HRVVHGGDRFHAPTRLTPAVLTTLEAVSALAPLHNPPALAGIRAAQAALGPAVPQVVVFDTTFYTTLPPVAFTYALPAALTAQYNIRRYGFHGIAHAALLAGYCAARAIPPAAATIITLQLGGGCSATAIRQGQAVDTSMGFTPLEGLVMGTRAGDLDPALPAFLARQTGATLDDVDQLLNHEAGLRGIAGGNGDMRELLARRAGDPQAALAVDLFCYRARKYIGAYLAVLGGAQALVFGGGIGEHAPVIRAEICAGLEWAGVQLDPARNQAATGGAARISADAARISVYVVPVDEAAAIATATVACLRNADRD